jgi:hypothetical protein
VIISAKNTEWRYWRLSVRAIAILLICITQSSCIPLASTYYRPTLLESYKTKVYRHYLEVTGIEGVKVGVHYASAADILMAAPPSLYVNFEPTARHVVRMTTDVVQFQMASTTTQDIRITKLDGSVYRSKGKRHGTEIFEIAPLDSMLGSDLQRVDGDLPVVLSEYRFQLILPEPLPASFSVILPALEVDGVISKNLVVRFDRVRRIKMMPLME